MKAKIVRGSGFRGVLDYTLKKSGGELLGGSTTGSMTGATPRQLAAEFGAVRKLRPDIEKPVWHCSLALPAGEVIEPDRWLAIASDFMTEMGFSDRTPYVVVRHHDTDHDHIHIVASRIDVAGQVWLGQWEARAAIEATQRLEGLYGLTPTDGLGTERAEVKGLTRGEIEMAISTGLEPPRQRLQRVVAAAAEGRPTVPQFVERLQLAGVGVRANIASTGRLSGFSFEIDGIAFTGRNLGASFSWSGLQKRGVTYEQNRDGESLGQLAAAASVDLGGTALGADRSAATPGAGGIAPDVGGRGSSSSGTAAGLVSPAGSGTSHEHSPEGFDQRPGEPGDRGAPRAGRGDREGVESGQNGSGWHHGAAGATESGSRRADATARGIEGSTAPRSAPDPLVASPARCRADRDDHDGWNARLAAARERRAQAVDDVRQNLGAGHATGARADERHFAAVVVQMLESWIPFGHRAMRAALGWLTGQPPTPDPAPQPESVRMDRPRGPRM
uniref:MobA n=1 Tax=Aeromonas sobria TaxID=646 RepID=A0A2H5BSD8_AERSO|nr:mobA [Aeromonas sobria]